MSGWLASDLRIDGFGGGAFVTTDNDDFRERAFVERTTTGSPAPAFVLAVCDCCCAAARSWSEAERNDS